MSIEEQQIPWPRVIEMFDALLALPAAEREARLASMTSDDVFVRREVASLLRALEGTALDRAPLPAGRLAVAPLGPGARLGPWVITRKVGEGGMGTVYEAARGDAAYEGRVAIKTLGARAVTAGATRRFLQERQILASLQHPHIAALLDGGTTDDGQPYLVMEFVDGEPIDRWCDARQLNIAARLDLFRQVCDALHYAHRNLVVHRDLKPSNILVTVDGRVKVVDFGIAKLLDDESGAGAMTADTRVPMTPAYASPEQVRGAPITTASDVYSLGVVLHQLIGGGSPYGQQDGTPLALFTAITERPPLPPSATVTDTTARARGLPHARSLRDALSRELDAIVLMALRKEPDRRYAGADALGDDVRRFLRGLPVTARPDTLGYRTRLFVRRQRALVAAVGIALIAVVGGALSSRREAGRAAAESARSERIATFLQTILGASDVFLEGSELPLGPTGSVAELLDSASRRIPRQFADDARIRARLYGTIGSALRSRSRMREATLMLDSAALLAEATYGPASPERVTALLDAAAALVHRSQFQEAEQRVQRAREALTGSGQRGAALQVRVLHELATIAFVRGDLRAVDSLARQGLAIDSTRRARPSVVRASLLNRLGAIEAATGAFARSDTTLRRALATHDSAHASFTVERADILNNLAMTLALTGRLAAADSLCDAGADAVQRTMGDGSREAAIFEVCRGAFALVRGDTAASRRRLLRARQIADSIPEVVLAFRLRPREALVSLDMVTGRTRSADSVAAELYEIARRGHWLERLNADMTWARTRGSLRDFATAESLFLDAARLQDSVGVRVPGVDGWVRVSLAEIYSVTDRRPAADSILRLLSTAEQRQVADWVSTFHGRRHAEGSRR